jgi:hypothetical protein
MKATITLGKGDSWGLGFEFYPSDWAITFHFICWYLLIEKNYNG